MEFIELLREAELGIAVDFDGPELTCPVCNGTYDQMAVVFDIAGIEALDCWTCGVVAA